MACIDHTSMNSSAFESHMYLQEPNRRIPGNFSIQPHPRPRRPALIPHNASLTLAEAEELVRTRIHQPLFPPPDPNLIHRVSSDPPSPSSDLSPSTMPALQIERGSRTEHCSAAKPSSAPPLYPDSPFKQHDSPPTTRPTHRHSFSTSLPKDHSNANPSRAFYLKARAQYIRDLKHRLSHPQFNQPQRRNDSLPQVFDPMAHAPVACPPKRKHSAFLLDEERKCHMEDVVGTPHLSEMVPGDDVSAQLNIEDLRMGEPAVMDALVAPDVNATKTEPRSC